jgi:hypothetical protein
MFLTDGNHLRYDIKSDQLDAGYPKTVDNITWPGLGN